MRDTSDLSCSQAGCTVNIDGICREAIDDPRSCPHSAIRELPNAEADGNALDQDDALIAEQQSNWVTLSGGYELTAAEADSITAQHDTRVIAFAGEPDAGKTTLIATIFEQFSKKVYSGHRFAGSETLLAFERACFLSRISSGAGRPDTDRTKYMRPRFYHLELVRESGDPTVRQHLLLADISGEAYRRASDTDEDAKKLQFLKRANTFILIVDGERLTSRTERQDTVQRGLLILRALLHSEVLSPSSAVTVVVTKFDLLQAEDRNTQQFLSYCKNEFTRLFKESFLFFEVREIAARPHNSSLPFGFAVEELVCSWLKEQDAHHYVLPEERAALPANIREADSFLWRQRSRGAR